MTTYALRHIAGSAFSLTLSTETSPISMAGEPDADLFDWGVGLVLVGVNTRVVIAGQWVSSVGPNWILSFHENSTAAWPAGEHEVRLAYTSPEATPRRFEQRTNLAMEVTR